MFSKMAMQHKRQAPGRDIHRHFSRAPARGHTMTASNKASASSKASATAHSEQRAETQTVGEGQKREGQWYAVHAHAAPPSLPLTATRRRPGARRSLASTCPPAPDRSPLPAGLARALGSRHSLLRGGHFPVVRHPPFCCLVGLYFKTKSQAK